MRKTLVALLSAIVVGLMLAPGSVSAGTTSIVVQDQRGDLGPKLDFSTGEMLVSWPDTMVLKKVGYLDMLSFSLSYSSKEKTYTFGMEVAKALPESGSSLPGGWKLVRWVMWIEDQPWHPALNNIPSLYTIQLAYDGSVYEALLKDYSTGVVLATLPFEVSGCTLQVEFSAASIGNLASFWFMPCTVVQWSVPPLAGYWDLDTTDPGAAPGQIWWDVPWPPQ